MNTSKEITNRLASMIDAAKKGDYETGRELLSIASKKMKIHGALDPSLVGYVALILENAYRSLPGDTAKALNINPPSNPKHRPKNNIRKIAMHRALDIASEQRTFGEEEPDVRDLLEIDPLELHISDAECEINRQELNNNYARYWNGKRKLTRGELFKLASKLFNRALKEDQFKGQRNDEKKSTPSAMQSEFYRREK
jgi:hypothetical protein